MRNPHALGEFSVDAKKRPQGAVRWESKPLRPLLGSKTTFLSRKTYDLWGS